MIDLAQGVNELADAQARAAKADLEMQGVEEELAEAKRAYSALIRTLRDRWDHAHFEYERARRDVVRAFAQLNETVQ